MPSDPVGYRRRRHAITTPRLAFASGPRTSDLALVPPTLSVPCDSVSEKATAASVGNAVDDYDRLEAFESEEQMEELRPRQLLDDTCEATSFGRAHRQNESSSAPD